MVAQAAPHALLVVNWGSAGAALLSVPTREYFQARTASSYSDPPLTVHAQSSGWTEPENEKQAVPRPPQPRMRERSQGRPAARSRSRPPAASSSSAARFADERRELQSLRSGSQFWADGRGTPGTGAGTEHLGLRDWDLDPEGKRSEELWRRGMRQQDGIYDHASLEADDDDDDARTEDGRDPALRPGAYAAADNQAPDESGAQNAFVAGMMYALTKRVRTSRTSFPTRPLTSCTSQVVPGAPYSPLSDPDAWHPREGPWRLEESLKYVVLYLF